MPPSKPEEESMSTIRVPWPDPATVPAPEGPTPGAVCTHIWQALLRDLISKYRQTDPEVVKVLSAELGRAPPVPAVLVGLDDESTLGLPVFEITLPDGRVARVRGQNEWIAWKSLKEYFGITSAVGFEPAIRRVEGEGGG